MAELVALFVNGKEGAMDGDPVVGFIDDTIVVAGDNLQFVSLSTPVQAFYRVVETSDMLDPRKDTTSAVTIPVGGMPTGLEYSTDNVQYQTNGNLAVANGGNKPIWLRQTQALDVGDYRINFVFPPLVAGARLAALVTAAFPTVEATRLVMGWAPIEGALYHLGRYRKTTETDYSEWEVVGDGEYEITGLEPDTSYFVQAIGVDARGLGAVATFMQATDETTSTPVFLQEAEILTATGTFCRVSAEAEDPEEGVLTYKVAVTQAATPPSDWSGYDDFAHEDVVAGVGVSGLIPDTAYYAHVRAVTNTSSPAISTSAQFSTKLHLSLVWGEDFSSYTNGQDIVPDNYIELYDSRGGVEPYTVKAAAHSTERVVEVINGNTSQSLAAGLNANFVSEEVGGASLAGDGAIVKYRFFMPPGTGAFTSGNYIYLFDRSPTTGGARGILQALAYDGDIRLYYNGAFEAVGSGVFGGITNNTVVTLEMLLKAGEDEILLRLNETGDWIARPTRGATGVQPALTDELSLARMYHVAGIGAQVGTKIGSISVREA